MEPHDTLPEEAAPAEDKSLDGSFQSDVHETQCEAMLHTLRTSYTNSLRSTLWNSKCAPQSRCCAEMLFVILWIPQHSHTVLCVHSHHCLTETRDAPTHSLWFGEALEHVVDFQGFFVGKEYLCSALWKRDGAASVRTTQCHFPLTWDHQHCHCYSSKH